MQGNSWAQFSLPARVRFESDSAANLAGYLRQFGNRVLLLNLRTENKNPEQFEKIRAELSRTLDGVIVYDDLHEDADTDHIDSVGHFARRSHANVIAAYGSIETIFIAKAVSILATNTVFAADLINNRGNIKYDSLPLVILPVEPTLGEELTPSFMVTDAADGIRKYFAHEKAFPEAVFYDPVIASHLTSDGAARVGGGLMVYAIESQLCPSSNPITSALILKTIDTLKTTLPGFYRDPKNEKTISTMMWASAMVGSSIAASPTGVAFATASALKTRCGLNFFDALALVLPHVMEYYLTAAPAQYINIAKSLGEDVKDISVIEAAIKAVEGIRRLFLEVNLPSRLSEFDVKKHQLSDVAQTASDLPQIENAPRTLSRNEIESILLAAF